MNSIMRFFRNDKVVYVFTACMVLLWAYINFRLKNRFFALFIVAFLILLFASRKRTLAVVAIPVLFVMFYSTPLSEALNRVKSTALNAAADPSAMVNDLFTADSGRENLDWDILWMNTAIQEFDLDDYRLSPNLEAETRIIQRVVETAWPVKLEPTSLNVFISQEEQAQFDKCDLVDKERNILLVHCP